MLSKISHVLERFVVSDDVVAVPKPPCLDMVAREDSLYGLTPR
jgi:hypothetical protein